MNPSKFFSRCLLGLGFLAWILMRPFPPAQAQTGQAPAGSGALSKDPSAFWVYVGTYTGPKSQGIYAAKLNLSSGELTPPVLAAESPNPSFLALHPNRRFLYAVNEISRFEDKPAGAVSAFGVDAATGKLTAINQQSSGGEGPCHLVVDPSGRNALTANYGGGSVAVLPIRENGALGHRSSFIQHTGSSVNPNRQKEPHAHSINVDPGNRFAMAADLGLDKILIYRFNAAAGALTPNTPPHVSVAPGAGPRHFAFHPTRPFAYVINELFCTVTAFSFDPRSGALTELQTISTLPPGETVKPGQSTAEVQVHPSGKFLYGSNRGHDTIVAYAIDETAGRLTWVENEATRGRTPRNFGIDPTGAYLLAANQSSDTIAVFRIDPRRGSLEPAGEPVTAPSPVCVKFVPAL